ncbi:MAG: serine/threonine protein kinase [Deltaproteobacteria bacterium]|nr:serine/threonine protein kinase [Deltaproteobacteria bacterium]
MIQVGQVLDKYELLERVGQGGMAVVYRGVDRTLKRVVAIKVLHKHLSDYQEARDRFEREAQAVAKLRHENILEIFDYAAKPDSEAYIVTEFIDGQTLKQVITDRPIAFPEIGAMLLLQVSRALAHAHAGGILHRDVKPENIMIRSDGVVKLMDFGISHMVDLERLTVTGQLLGSPAYMAPEHVEGRPIDYRTDVFAAGIVLYQLCVGRLPFEGKNPHEVLKRIAECKFIDPRTANPRIGNRLGRIILRAMAMQPDDRFPAIGEMVVALEAYLEESGIATDKISGELARYFSAPAAYEQALEDRLIDHLTRRGQKLLDADERAAALDVFDRVLTIDSDNEKVIAILDGINRRLRLKAIALGVLAASVIGGGAFMIHRKSLPPGPEMPATPDHPGSAIAQWPMTNVAADDRPPELVAVVDAGVEVVDAYVVGGNNPNVRPPVADASPVISAKELWVTVTPAQGAQVDFGDGTWIDVTSEDGRLARIMEHNATIRARNKCCESQEAAVTVGQSQVVFDLVFKPGQIIPTCKLAAGEQPIPVSVRIAGSPATLGQKTAHFFERSFAEEVVEIEFTTSPPEGSKETAKNWVQKHKVRAGETMKVECAPPP